MVYIDGKKKNTTQMLPTNLHCSKHNIKGIKKDKHREKQANSAFKSYLSKGYANLAIE